jgi:hypothetical protein
MFGSFTSIYSLPTRSITMLNLFLVRCPHAGCHWSGFLTPLPGPHLRRGNEATPHFACPECHEEWHAQMHGAEADPESMDCLYEEDALPWPLVDMGVSG